MKNVEWGEYKLGDLFESSNGNFDIQKEHINGKGDYVITAGLTNNGILGKTNVKAKVFNGNTITVDMFGFAFYRQFKYKMVTHARVFSLIPKFTISKNQGLFLANSLHFLNRKYGYENMCSWTKIIDEVIQLPTQNGEIDFDFMESFIAEMEAERVAELEAERVAELTAYLKVSGLDNYKLSTNESKALDDFESLKWKEYSLDNLFDVLSSKKKFDANKTCIKENEGCPYVVRTASNNGLKGYINEDKKFLNDGNTISFGQDTATMFYQEKPYFTGDKIKILKPKICQFNKNNAHFLLSTMKKTFSSFTWGGTSFSSNKIKSQTIFLPTENESIDFEFMKTFISAIKKLVIKDVVLYADKKISATKDIINQD